MYSFGSSVAGSDETGNAVVHGQNPIVFALANPNPEITYPDAIAAHVKMSSSWLPEDRITQIR